MLKLVKMKVLLVGVKGVGIEMAKNTVLAGVNTLTLCDAEPTAIRDLGTNFFLTEADVGKARAVVCAPKLAELNSTVNVVASSTGLTEELVAVRQLRHRFRRFFVHFSGLYHPHTRCVMWSTSCAC